MAEFQSMQLPSFYGEYNPTVAKNWLIKKEKIFEVLNCTNNQKITNATYMLAGEAKH